MTGNMRHGLLAVAVAALMLPVGIYSGIVYTGHVSVGDSDDESADEDGFVPPDEIGDLKYLTLNTTVPSKTPNMRVYRLAVPDYSRVWCENKVRQLYPGWLDGNVTVESSKFIINITIFRKGTETITVKENGEFEYHDNSVDLKWSAIYRDYENRRQNDTGASISGMISQTEAYDVAVGYIRAHGGFPQDYVSLANHTSITAHNDISTNSSYFITFTQKFDGYILMEQCAMVWVTPLGDVESFTVLWRETAGAKSTVKVVSAAKALEYLDKSGVFYEKTSIEKMELGYSAESHFTITTEMVPVWIFHADPESGGNVVVDAVGLNFAG
jgi:hypothetical protein